MTQKQFIEKFSLFNPELEVWFNDRNTNCILEGYLNDAYWNQKLGIENNKDFSIFDNCIYTPTKIICLL